MPVGRLIFILGLAAAYVGGLQAFNQAAGRQVQTMSHAYDTSRLTASVEAGCDTLCR